MLTDYHLHLRPDEDGTTFDRYFTAENVDRYLTAAAAAGIEELGVSEHVYRFRQALDLWRHPLWVENAHDDHDAWDVWEGGDPDEIWRRYFEMLAQCARSGLFDILAHPDLVKVWGRARPLPDRDPRFFYEPAVEAIAESGIAVEVSTAGLRKPVGEIYPAAGFAEMCIEAGAAFALSSDAHLPEQVGYGYDKAIDFLTDLGVEEICVFDRRQRRLEPLPAP